MKEKLSDQEKNEAGLVDKLCKKIRHNLFKTILIGSGVLASGIGIMGRLENNNESKKKDQNIDIENYFEGFDEILNKSDYAEMFNTLRSIEKENPNLRNVIDDPALENSKTNIGIEFNDLFSFDITLTKDEIKLGKVILKILNDYSSNFSEPEFSDAMDIQRLVELLQTMQINNKDTLNHPLVSRAEYGKPREIIVSGVSSDEAGINSFGKSDKENMAIAKLRQENAIIKIELILSLYKINTKISRGENIEKVLSKSQIELIEKEAKINNLSVMELVRRYNRNININESSINQLDELLSENRAVNISIIYEDNHKEIVRFPIPYILFILLGLKLYNKNK